MLFYHKIKDLQIFYLVLLLWNDVQILCLCGSNLCWSSSNQSLRSHNNVLTVFMRKRNNFKIHFQIPEINKVMFAGIILHVRECTISMQLFNRKDIPLRENLATQIFPQQNSFACISSPLLIKINRVQTCTEQPGDHFFQVYRTHQLTSEIKIILFSWYSVENEWWVCQWPELDWQADLLVFENLLTFLTKIAKIKVN